MTSDAAWAWIFVPCAVIDAVTVGTMFDIRTISAEDADLFRSRVSRGFGHDAETDETARRRFDAIFEFDRTFAAFEGDDIIGTGAAFSLGVTAPGGAEVPMGGTTVITVQPTHRRRGVLRSLMEAHLDDVAERGEPLAGLWASESSIYGRFGYGPATYRHDATIDAHAVRFLTEPSHGSVRLVETEKAEPILRSLYEQARPQRHGMLTRSDAWWTHRLMADPEAWRSGASMRRYAVFEESGSVTGYASYRQKEKWDHFLAHGEIRVGEVITTSPAAHSALWSYLTNIDLFTDVQWWNMPIDDPLPLQVTDHRRITRRLTDALWVRIMDVPAALSARSYAVEGGLTFEIEDGFRPETSGTYRLEVIDGVGGCERTSGPADVRMDADVLGSLYLGGGDAIGHAAAGRLHGDGAAILKAHRLFRTDVAPWCPEVF